MRKIQMVDLQIQYEKYAQEINQAVQNVFTQATFINGPDVAGFAKEFGNYLGVKHVIPCANGTDALQIAFMALGLVPGDRVVAPDFTFVATAEAAAVLKLTVDFADIHAQYFTLENESIKKNIQAHTKAIVPVHLFGQCADMENILQIAKENNLYVIEDVAQAHGAEYTFSNGTKKKAGTMGHIGCFSFYPSKNLGAYGDAGALVTNDDELAAKIRKVANHGQSERYYYDEIGINSRLDTIQAAILRIKLKHLNTFIQERNRVASTYTKLLNTIGTQVQLPGIAPYSTHVFHQYTIKVPSNVRADLQKHLASKEIPSVIFYPVPLHFQKAYQSNNNLNTHLKESIQAAETVLSLPIYPEMEQEQIEFVAHAMIDFFTNKV